MNKSPAKRNSEKQIDVVQKLLAHIDEQDMDEQVVPEVEETLEVLVFQLNREKYGIPIEHVVEIIRFVEATEVPHTVNFLEGIISLRGEMIPVINGRERLGHEPKSPDKQTRTIILQEGSNRYGIVVDAATQVVNLLKKNIEPTPPIVIGIDAEFIEGVCEHKGQLVILLNLHRFLEFT
jgi:purine-binding chemotaxis protein CheW